MGRKTTSELTSADAPAVDAVPTVVPPRGIGPISQPNPNDVLCGRGKRINSHAGNVRMRDLVCAVRATYLAESTQKFEKTMIAGEIVRQIRSMDPPGRFLRRDAETGLWWDMGDLLAVKKVGQALRESAADVRRVMRLQEAERRDEEVRGEEEKEREGGGTAQLNDAAASWLASGLVSQNWEGVFEELGFWINANLSDPKRKMSQARPPSPPKEAATMSPMTRRREVAAAEQQRTGCVSPESVPGDQESTSQGFKSAFGSPEQSPMLSSKGSGDLFRTTVAQDPSTSTVSNNGSSPQQSPVTSSKRTVDLLRTSPKEGADAPRVSDGLSQCDKDAAEFLLSAFDHDSDAPIFTEEEERREREQITEEERNVIRADLYGGLCESSSHHRKKLIRLAQELQMEGRFDVSGLRELVPLSIQSLLEDMKYEIEMFPLHKKTAFGEAQGKCASNEAFNDDFMELFLRREKMNPKLAAERYVKYWEKRRSLFGPDKFHLPMTLCGALRDDLDALGTGTFRVLPKDASGRRIILWDFCRDTKYGYTRNSMLRAAWYTLESALEDGGARRGIVVMGWNKNCSLWHYDRKLESGFLEFERLHLPVRFAAVHCCCVSTPVMHFLKPIMLAYFDRQIRSRLMIHDIEDTKILDVLRNFGITRDVIPIEMGGEVNQRHSTWLRGRIAEGK